MTDTQALKQKLQDAYKFWHDTRGGSVDAWMALMDENVCFGSMADGSEPLPFTQPRSGRDQLKDYFNGLLSAWEMIHYTVDQLVAEGDRVVMIGSTAWTNKQTGKRADTRKVDVWRFKDGRAIEFYEYYDTAKLLDAATPG